MRHRYFSTLLLALAASAAAQDAQITHEILEAYPDEIRAALEVRDRHLRRRPVPVGGGGALQMVVQTGLRWAPAATVTIAFKDGEGDPSLRGDIAAVAQEWTKYGNLKLDFGHDPKTGLYRTWTEKDVNYSAEIRITFSDRGYWSVVGTDSVNPSILNPNNPSMSLSGFITKRPANWIGVVLHEFGHALGFHHEHQSPLSGCDEEFRWDDDLDYHPTRDEFGQFVADAQGRRPGVYTVLAGAPNRWPKDKVNANLRQLQSGGGLSASEYDPLSIMHYAFPAWMFRRPDSPCYTSVNHVLSATDKDGMLRAYPHDPNAVEALTKDREKGLELLAETGNDPAAAREFRAHLEAMDK